MLKSDNLNTCDTTTLHSVLDGMNVPTFVIDKEHNVKVWNHAIESMTNITSSSVLGTNQQWRGFYNHARSTLADLIIDGISDIPKTLYGIIQPSKYVKNGLHSECWLEINNSLRYVVFDAVPILNDIGEIIGAVETLQDVTDMKNVVSNLELSARVINAMSEGVIVMNADNTIVAVNESFSKISGFKVSDVINQKPDILVSDLGPSILDVLNSNHIIDDTWNGELWNKRPNDVSYPCSVSLNILRNKDGEVLNKVCVFSDISKLKEDEDQIRQLAHFDFLTGLPNRLLLTARMESAIAMADRSGKRFGIMFIDLDRFKNINDSMGHAFGDEILKIIANRLSTSIRQTDTVARLGGDEFIVLIVDANNDSDISHVANNLIDIISRPCDVSGNEITMFPSVGIAIYPTDGIDVDTLMRKADTAMYHAKSNGGCGFQFYADQFNNKAFELMFIENSLKKALEHKEFKLYIQPQYNMETKQICGSEALLRWRHVDMGMMPPARFIPIAEEAGLIIPIGKWVIEEACRIAKRLLDMGGVGLPLAVNISTVQMARTDLVSEVKEALLKYELPPSVLELEVTESALMLDVDRAISILNEVGRIGVHIAIDDFGTGYSSLSRLKNFPLKKLKVDRSFVKDIEVDLDDAEICKAIISLAHNLRLNVVAEGVETEGQATFLKEAGCNIYQGYLLSPPIPEEDFYKLALNHKDNIDA